EPLLTLVIVRLGVFQTLSEDSRGQTDVPLLLYLLYEQSAAPHVDLVCLPLFHPDKNGLLLSYITKLRRTQDFRSVYNDPLTKGYHWKHRYTNRRLLPPSPL
ncbi:MAG TPA: hypothetical protein VLB68_16790, partial [Pyrinomonadaceae bacterium]|nr:hypothetical protein [Pyrinomonadaceae bacterium]